MYQKHYQAIAVAALLSSGLFLLVLGLGLPAFFMFLPTLPIFSLGLSKHPNLSLVATLISFIPIALASDNILAGIYLFVFALPSWYICHSALMSRDLQLGGEQRVHFRLWFPMGLTLTYIAIYACIITAAVTALYAIGGDASLPATLATAVNGEIAKLQKQYAIELYVSSEQLSFMVCAFMAWMWVVALWLHACLANRALSKRNIARRFNLVVTPFPMPNWMLSLMGICALAALAGGESLRFLGSACLIILLLPYFFLGISIIHMASLAWPNRRFFLGIMYFCILTLFWPAFIVSGVGMYRHLKILNKHLSAS